MAAKKSALPSYSPVSIANRISGVRAAPKAKGNRPAVILLHERYGIDQHTRDLTVKLAAAGFVGVAPDLFSRFTGDRKALQRGDVRVELRDDEVLQDLGDVMNYLKRSRGVDASRIGVIGVCQTGRQALLLAAHRTDIAASVVLYGAIGGKEWQTNEMRPEPVERLVENCTCPVLGVFGEADHIISIDDVLRFRGCLEQAKNSYHVRIYRDAPHGWLNDTMPGRYRKQQANHAWNLIVSFLKKSFDDGWDPDRVSWTFESNFSVDYDFSKNVRLA
ncbi:MAG TPA: dienelactone hydrolase family protein [candidate division Zixibacteria bacterium]|nr:dienelactone hydrolase family protein [candidate division Zixibacteria bacterium]